MKKKWPVKALLERIIPINILRNIKLLTTPDYWKFGKPLKQAGEYLVIESSYNRFFDTVSNPLNKALSDGFNECYDEYEKHTGLMRKYVLRVDNVIIEPEMGWAVLKEKNKLVFDSVSNNSWRQNYYPSYDKYIRNKDAAKKVEEAVSINMIKGGELNYWHFIHDFLGEVFLAKKYLPHVNSYIISRNLSERSYFRYALSASAFLRSCNWIIREDFLEVKKAYFIQCLPNSVEQLIGVKGFFKAIIPSVSMQKKVYLTRSRNRIRHLKNEEEISAMLAGYGFVVVDADHLTMEEQINLFANTQYLVGIHGAGLTNILFAPDSSLAILEIFPKKYLQPHYYTVSMAGHQKYYYAIGSDLTIDSSFVVDKDEVEKQVKTMLG